MTIPNRCPFCASEKVYSYLNTHHCMRCKNMWHENRKSRDQFSGPMPGISTDRPVLRQKNCTDTLGKRLEKELEDCLKRHQGKICPERIHPVGSREGELFRQYVRTCVTNRTLVGKKDRHGITWYSRPGPDLRAFGRRSTAADRSRRGTD